MNFEDFVKEGKVRVAEKNTDLINSLLKTSEEDLKFLKTLKINQSSARKVFSSYYDVLRSMLEALALSKGYKIYSHEAFKFFLETIQEEVIAIKFDKFRRLRNDINYYGKDVQIEETIENVEEMISLIKKLKNKI